MIKIILSFLLILQGSNLIAQYGTYKTDGNIFREKKYMDIEGTPYYYKTWVKADLYDINGQILENVDVNYNGATGKFESIRDDYNFIELNNALYNKIIVNQGIEADVFINFLEYGDEAYYRLIYKGDDFSYFSKFWARIKKEEIPNYGQSSTKERFSNSEEYYFLKEDKLAKVKRNSKDIVKYLNNKSINNYIKSNKLNIKNDKDLQKLFRYYDSLK